MQCNHSGACNFPRLNAPAAKPLVPPASIAVRVDPPGRHRQRGGRWLWRSNGGGAIRENCNLSRCVQMVAQRMGTREGLNRARAVADGGASRQRRGDAGAGAAIPVDSVERRLLDHTHFGRQTLGRTHRVTCLCSLSCHQPMHAGVLLMMWFAGGGGSYRAFAVGYFRASQWRKRPFRAVVLRPDWPLVLVRPRMFGVEPIVPRGAAVRVDGAENVAAVRCKEVGRDTVAPAGPDQSEGSQWGRRPITYSHLSNDLLPPTKVDLPTRFLDSTQDMAGRTGRAMFAQEWMQGRHGGAPYLLSSAPLQVQVLQVFFGLTPDTGGVAKKSRKATSARGRTARRGDLAMLVEDGLQQRNSQEESCFRVEG